MTDTVLLDARQYEGCDAQLKSNVQYYYLGKFANKFDDMIAR